MEWERQNGEGHLKAEVGGLKMEAGKVGLTAEIIAALADEALPESLLWAKVRRGGAAERRKRRRGECISV